MTDTWKSENDSQSVELAHREEDGYVTMTVDLLDDVAAFDEAETRSLGQWLIEQAEAMRGAPTPTWDLYS
jgi:hypothetical protein